MSHAALQKLLGGPAAGLDKLSDAACQQLSAQIEQAQQAQERALRDALEKTLSHIPLLLRGAVRKLFESGS